MRVTGCKGWSTGGLGLISRQGPSQGEVAWTVFMETDAKLTTERKGKQAMSAQGSGMRRGEARRGEARRGEARRAERSDDLNAAIMLYSVNFCYFSKLPDLMHSEALQTEPAVTFLCQNIGLVLGIGIMLVIALYEEQLMAITF